MYIVLWRCSVVRSGIKWVGFDSTKWCRVVFNGIDSVRYTYILLIKRGVVVRASTSLHYTITLYYMVHILLYLVDVDVKVTNGNSNKRLLHIVQYSTMIHPSVMTKRHCSGLLVVGYNLIYSTNT